MWITFYFAISSVILYASAELSNFKEGLCAPPNNLYITGLMQKCTSDMDCSDDLKCCESKSQMKVCAPPQPAFTACQHQRAFAVEIARSIDSSTNFLPECIENDGSFAPVQCSEQKGRCWCVDQAGFEIPGTRAPFGMAMNCSAPRICPNPECRMLCPQSFVIQKDGCPVCQCYDACEDIKCPRSTKCITDSVKCVNEPCPPISKCAARAIDDVDCPSGLPALVDVNKKDYFLCSLLNNVKASKCPVGFECNVRPNKEFGVCCPQAEENVVKAGQCPPLKRNDKSCVVECRVDQDCYGTSKCCSDNCTALCLSPVVPTACQAQRAGSEKIPGVFSPTCEDDGRFAQVQCFGQKCWCVDPLAGSEIFGTRKVDGSLPDCSAPSRCANLKCDLQCDHGYKVDADGCPMCSCHLPCEDLGCPNECNVVELDCGGPTCPVVASCKESRKLDHPCIYGSPIRDNRTKDYSLCGDFPGMITCPEKFSCELIDAEGHGFCCPKPTGQPAVQIPPFEEKRKLVEHFGRCPAPIIGNLQQCGQACSKDRECAHDEKCCETSCGLTCTKAVTKTSCQIKAESFAAVAAFSHLPTIRCDAKGGYEPVQCNRQKCWCSDNLGNEMPGTRVALALNLTIDCSKSRQCNPECRMLCPFGFVFDEEGCPACDCVNPCDGIICPSGTECQVQGTECLKEPCPFVPKCIARPTVLNPCSFGIPLQNPMLNTTVVCGPLAGQIECPITHECVSGAPDQPPVCCERESVDVCRLSKDTGPCRAAFKKWHFNSLSKQCEEFVYGGCEGNPNNFPSKAVCEKICGTTPVNVPSQAHCPVPQMDGSSICVNECTVDGDCPGSSMCCGNGCGRVCSEAVFQTACDIQKTAYTRMSRFAKDMFKDQIYVPDCRPDGAFDKMQCDGRKEVCWCVDENGQEVDGTRKPYDQNMSCSRKIDTRICENTMMCRMDCPLGFVKNLTDGCPICDCVDPCELYDCPNFQECKVMELKSVENVISRFPICAPRTPPPATCPFGIPLKAANSDHFRICFNDSACPSTHSCSVQQEGAKTGVCCSKTATVCLLQTEVGPCRGTIPRWAFDTVSQSCKIFSYGGCQGNGNNFATRIECENVCVPSFTMAEKTSIMVVPQDPRSDGSISASDFCLLGTPIPTVSGLTNGSLELCAEGATCPLTHFCSSNNNRVMCCPKTTDDCFLPVISGQCASDITRFHFDPKTKSCQQFQYSGCGANGNSFASETQCRALCAVMSDCEFKRQVAIAQQRSSSVPIFIPECDEFDGSWLPVQCQLAAGVCWCVDSKGHADMTTAVRGFPKCSELTVPSNASMEICEEGEAMQFCDPNMCRHQVCLGNPRANCRVNPCGGCSVDFFDYNNEKVDCFEGLTECQRDFLTTMHSPNWAKLSIPPPLMAPGTKSSFNGAKIIQIFATPNETLPSKLGVCPPYFALPSEGCTIECRDDSQCSGDHKCCFAGCGYVCVPALPISTVKPGQCPLPQISGPVQEEVSCSSECNTDADCPASKKCCGKGSCGGFTCIEPVVNRILMPLYLPACDIQGKHEWTQCSGEICWCVDNNGTTRPETITRGQIQCNATGIMAGSIHKVCQNGTAPLVCKEACRKATCKNHPEAFCVSDPCNECAVEFVNQEGKTVDCKDTCSQSVEPGTCLTGETSERYFFNHYTQECHTFNYTGCGGNENNFISKEHCMQRCLPADICMQEVSTGPCRALIERWHFNRRSGQCEMFDYGGCQGNGNNFATKAACEARCPQILTCPKISSTATLSTCNRSGICEQAKCAHPLAECKVDPCTCQPNFVDKWGRKQPCESLPTKCHTEAMEKSVMADIYHPQCEDNGKYKSLQCFADHFSEKCWCVDDAGNAINEDRFANGERQCQSVTIDGVQITMRFALDNRSPNSTEDKVRDKLTSLLHDLNKDNIVEESLLLVPVKHSVLAKMNLRGERSPDIAYFFQKLINTTTSDLHLLQMQTEFDRPALNVVPADRSLLPEETTWQDAPVEAKRQDLLPLLSILAIVLIIAIVIGVFLYRRRRTGSYTNRQSIPNPDVEKTSELPIKTLPNDYVSIPFIGSTQRVDNIYENPKQ